MLTGRPDGLGEDVSSTVLRLTTITVRALSVLVALHVGAGRRTPSLLQSGRALLVPMDHSPSSAAAPVPYLEFAWRAFAPFISSRELPQGAALHPLAAGLAYARAWIRAIASDCSTTRRSAI